MQDIKRICALKVALKIASMIIPMLIISASSIGADVPRYIHSPPAYEAFQRLRLEC